jgi:inosose dehydratase
VSRFKLGFAPITWNNEDLRTELGPFVPYETLLDEVVAAGYRATELGDGFPRDPSELRGALNARSLAMPSAWCGLGFFQVSPMEDLEHTRRLCDFLAESGASYVNLAHYGSPERMAVACRAATASETPRLTPGQWDELSQRVGQAAEIARDAGLQAAFHLHAGTWIETRAELTELLERVPAPLLKLCWDVGHAICGGIDPVEVVRAYPERIAYLHLKDVDGDVLAGVRRDRVPFADAVRKRVFTELGSGILDVPGLLAALAEIDYAGWLMVEQDSTWLAPIDSARTSRAYLASLGV